MLDNMWTPKQSPLQGLGGLWGGNFGNLVGGAGALYDFAGATFTGLTRSKDGPSLSQARTLTTGTSASNFKNDTSFFNVSSGIMVWTVPADGVYRIKVAGGRGGVNYDYDFTATQDAPAAIMQADFELEQGNYLAMVVASEGDPGYGNVNTGSCAGGGTFIYNTSAQSSPFTGGIGGNTLLIAAGGGGSTCPAGQQNNNSGSNKGVPGTAAPSPNGTGAQGTPGSNGTGGTTGGGTDYDGGAGAGWTSNCSDDVCGTRYAGGSDTNQSNDMHGGWGGGGGAHDGQRQEYVPAIGEYVPWAHGRAGGGGYSGGCGSYYSNVGSGGASYCKNTAETNTLFTSDGTFSTSGSEHSTAYSGNVGNLGAHNAGPGYCQITYMS
tara:strand:- start:70 stop:1203 length:1134 start_codon:yes stop_codon:yes gene_type:complete